MLHQHGPGGNMCTNIVGWICLQTLLPPGMAELLRLAAVGGAELHTNLLVSTKEVTRVLRDSRALAGAGEDLEEVSDKCALSRNLLLSLRSPTPYRMLCHTRCWQVWCRKFNVDALGAHSGYNRMRYETP